MSVLFIQSPCLSARPAHRLQLTQDRIVEAMIGCQSVVVPFDRPVPGTGHTVARAHVSQTATVRMARAQTALVEPLPGLPHRTDSL